LIYIFTIAIFSILNVALAQWDAELIANKKVINHLSNAAVYTVLLSIVFSISTNWVLMASLCLDRLLFFNISLNLYRKLKWNYMPQFPNSKIDMISNFVFLRNGYIQYGVYAALFIYTITKLPL
jgi:hypothetical protein